MVDTSTTSGIYLQAVYRHHYLARVNERNISVGVVVDVVIPCRYICGTLQ